MDAQGFSFFVAGVGDVLQSNISTFLRYMIRIRRDNLLPLSLFIYAKQILFILGTDQIQHRRFSKVSNCVCNHSPGTFM